MAKVELHRVCDDIISEKHTVTETDPLKAETTICLVYVCVRIHVHEPNVPLLHVFEPVTPSVCLAVVHLLELALSN